MLALFSQAQHAELDELTLDQNGMLSETAAF